MTQNFVSRALLALSATGAVLGVSASPLAAQDEMPAVIEVIDISQLTCRDLLTTSGDERDYIVLFIQGYLNGAEGVTEIDIAMLSADTDQAVDACIDDPSANLLEVFSSVRD